jgi:hypothetical protein
MEAFVMVTGEANNSPLLSIALEEAASSIGPSDATVAAIISSSIPNGALESFWLQLAEQFQDETRLAIARSALKLLDARDAGYEAIEFCLADENLSPEHKVRLGMDMQYVNSRKAVLWCHKQMVSRIQSDVYYNSFLARHVQTVVGECYEDMAAYLLFPDRGPSDYNIDSFFLVAQQLDDPKPFVLRLQSWIQTGRLDDEKWGGDGSAEILYDYYNDIIKSETNKFDGLIRFTLDWVIGLLRSREDSTRYKGLFHLICMVNTRFAAADRVLQNISSREVSRFSAGGWEKQLLKKLIRAFQLLAELNSASNEDVRSTNEAFSSTHREILESDFWSDMFEDAVIDNTSGPEN